MNRLDSHRPPQAGSGSGHAGNVAATLEGRAPAEDFSGSELARSRRVRLTGLRYADIPRISRLYAQTSHCPLLVDSPTRFIDVAALVACVNQLYARRPGLGVWRGDTLEGQFLGLFSLLPVDGSEDVEVHVRLAPEAWGRWFAVEGTHILCRQAFEHMGLSRVLAFSHPAHREARRIMLHFGFRDMGACEHRGKPAVRYALDAEAWRELRRLYT
ncbi:GNAT family N-acetyltransferase [Dyella sp.]|uniref:GNAT family N-acetyltransferase n=1 Tax=Dyella sp. TaxID=1869338 RepID=UPI002ED2393F